MYSYAVFNDELFQSTLPQGEWLRRCSSISTSKSFQSTLPQGEWLYSARLYCRGGIISIHTPTRGVTNEIPFIMLLLLNFNPHSHKGSDCDQQSSVHFLPISIHTPTRGVTFAFFNKLQFLLFQSTLPQGEWRFCKSVSVPIGLFQSTLPQGEWHVTIHIISSSIYFNPHSHKGNDLPAVAILLVYYIFQSTLPQGEWRHKNLLTLIR